MREILFRGFNRKNNRWLYGCYIQNRGSHFVCPDEFAEGKSWQDYEVNLTTIGQYTGLQDKYGAKIFEGDIVECVSWNEFFSNQTTGKVMELFRRRMEVVFMAGGFKLVEHLPQPCKDNVWNMIVEGDLIVIGNIHDNHELLEGGENG